MATIFALRGRGGSGKTTTIGLLYQLLVGRNYQLVSTNFQSVGKDFMSVFSIKGKLLGITSVGDTYDFVHDRLSDLINQRCEDLVCACRTFDRFGHGTNTAIHEFENFDHQFIEKTIDEDDDTQDATNAADAQRLLAAIENL